METLGTPLSNVGLNVGSKIFTFYIMLYINQLRANISGEGGIRTHGGVTPTTDFESVAFDLSATSPEPGAPRRVRGRAGNPSLTARPRPVNPAPDAAPGGQPCLGSTS